MKSKSRKGRGWLNTNLLRMDETASTAELVERLHVTDKTLLRWRNEDRFSAAGIVTTLENGRLVWDTRRLRLWLIWRGAIKKSKYLEKQQRNPPWTSAEECEVILWGDAD